MVIKFFSSDREEIAFIEQVFGTSLLEKAIEWIQNNLEPDDIFVEEELHEWATENDYISREWLDENGWIQPGDRRAEGSSD
jgi:hypothetical protein